MNRIKRYFKKYTLRELIGIIDERYGIALLERILFVNWFNPFATLWLNLRSFPLNQALFFPVWCYGRPKIYGLSGTMKVEGELWSGMIRFNQVKYGAPSNMSVQSEILNRGHIIFKGQGLIGTGTKIVVERYAQLEIGKNFKITDMCNIGCFRKITIGEQSWIVHRCQVLDSNYHFVANFTKRIVPWYSAPITIGKGCWICNSSTVTGGTVLPDYTIVGSNSLVNKDFSGIPENSMIAGIPAKYIATGFRRIENSIIENEIGLFYKDNPDGMFEIPISATPDEYSYLDKYK